MMCMQIVHAMFGGGRQAAQEVEQRPCEGAQSSEGVIFQTGFRKSLTGLSYFLVFYGCSIFSRLETLVFKICQDWKL